MNEELNKLFAGLLDVKNTQDIVMCLIDDLEALGDPKVSDLIKFWHLKVSKGQGFDQVYQYNKKRMETATREEQNVQPTNPTPPA